MNVNSNNLKIMFWNARSLYCNFLEFKHILKTHNIQIALINETFLKPHMKLSLKNYIIYRNDNNAMHGRGTAIIINDKIKHNLIPISRLESAEATAINIVLPFTNIVVVSAYFPCNSLIISDVDNLFNLGDRVILAGDFNARHRDWGCSNCNNNGLKLSNFLNDNINNLQLHFPESPTHFPSNPTHNPGTIDLAITKNVTVSSIPYTVTATNSDHNPVLLSISLTQHDLDEQIHKRLNYRLANWNQFKFFIDNTINTNACFTTGKDIDDAVTHLTTCIHQAIDKTIPTYCNYHNSNIIPQKLKLKLKIKNKLRRKWQQSRNPEIKYQLNKLTKELSFEMKLHSNKQWENKLKKY